MKKPLLVLILVAAATVITVSVLCGNYNEGSMNGACSVPALTPLYNGAMNILLLLAYTAIFWVPVLFLVLALYSSASSKRKSQTNQTSTEYRSSGKKSSTFKIVLGTAILIAAILGALKYLLVI